jgi:dipicolinate synthase subunit B
MEFKSVAFAVTGSFCSIAPCLAEMRRLIALGVRVTPIMSQSVAETDTRFYSSRNLNDIVCGITKTDVITTVKDAEPLGPKNLSDILVIAPCTSNTLAKIANGINDTPVTMAAKSVVRNGKPIVIALSTNDGLSASAINIGLLLNRKNIFFVPFTQDDPEKKPRSLVARFELLTQTMTEAVSGRQIQSILYRGV